MWGSEEDFSGTVCRGEGGPEGGCGPEDTWPPWAWGQEGKRQCYQSLGSV